MVLEASIKPPALQIFFTSQEEFGQSGPCPEELTQQRLLLYPHLSTLGDQETEPSSHQLGEETLKLALIPSSQTRQRHKSKILRRRHSPALWAAPAFFCNGCGGTCSSVRRRIDGSALAYPLPSECIGHCRSGPSRIILPFLQLITRSLPLTNATHSAPRQPKGFTNCKSGRGLEKALAGPHGPTVQMASTHLHISLPWLQPGCREGPLIHVAYFAFACSSRRLP